MVKQSMSVLLSIYCSLKNYIYGNRKIKIISLPVEWCSWWKIWNWSFITQSKASHCSIGMIWIINSFDLHIWKSFPTQTVMQTVYFHVPVSSFLSVKLGEERCLVRKTGSNQMLMSIVIRDVRALLGFHTSDIMRGWFFSYMIPELIVSFIACCAAVKYQLVRNIRNCS